jgi:hypothetical protein
VQIESIGGKPFVRDDLRQLSVMGRRRSQRFPEYIEEGEHFLPDNTHKSLLKSKYCSSFCGNS